MRPLPIAAGAAVASFLAIYLPTHLLTDSSSKPESFTGTVTKVADGDTINVGDRTIRLLGVDTPETHDPRKPVQCYGPQASAFTTVWTSGQPARVTTEPSTNATTDRYGRTIGYVTVRHQDLGSTLLRRGYARVYVFRGKPFGKLARYRRLEQQARDAGVGRWGTC